MILVLLEMAADTAGTAGTDTCTEASTTETQHGFIDLIKQMLGYTAQSKLWKELGANPATGCRLMPLVHSQNRKNIEAAA